MISEKNREFLLKLARKSIEYYIKNGRQKTLLAGNSPQNQELKEKLATFVTLTIDGELRGCIGKLLPAQALYADVVENAYLAAFEDTRFYPVTEDELIKIKIEISVLSRPVELRYKDIEELKKFLFVNKPGVILSWGLYQATYLPQVWKDIDDVDEFLGSLCLKAGLNAGQWKSGDCGIKTYTVESFSEK